MAKKVWKVLIDARFCKGCDICIRSCPPEILQVSDTPNARGYHPPYVIEGGECTGCMQCELLCPDFAIFIENGKADGG